MFRLRIQIITILTALFLLREVTSDDGIPTPPGGLTSSTKKQRYTQASTTKKKLKRTTPFRFSFEEDCDYLAFYCLKAYKTGVVCGRTIFYRYANFMTYCQLDYVNCMERYEVWQLAHMGECMEVPPLSDFLHYEYVDDYFLDEDFVSDE